MNSTIIDTSVLAFNIEKIRRSVFPKPEPIDFSLKEDDSMFYIPQNEEQLSDSRGLDTPVADTKNIFILETDSLI
jgi:hypothetical protein